METKTKTIKIISTFRNFRNEYLDFPDGEFWPDELPSKEDAIELISKYFERAYNVCPDNVINSLEDYGNFEHRGETVSILEI